MVTRRNLTLVFLFFMLWIVLALVLPALSASAAPAIGGTLVVTRLDDPAPNGCLSNDCSLREAVIAANALTDSDTITFAVNGTVELSIAGANEDNAQSGDLDITAPVTIQGVYHTFNVIDANSLDRVFDIHGLSTTNLVTITQLTIERGLVDGSDGGGIRIAAQTDVQIVGVTIRNNFAENGGGIINYGGLFLSQSAIIANGALEGGGVLTYRGITVNNTTISSNVISTPRNGAGTGMVGGILHRADGTPLQNMSLNSVTAIGNSMAQVGTQGINGGGARTYLRNTIVDGTFNGIACYTNSNSGSSAETYSSGYNIATNSSCNLSQSTDLPNTLPNLASLQGTVHYPNPDSPALDSGDTALTVDQLGFSRPYDLPDIPNSTDGDDRGAAEYNYPTFTVTWLDDPAPNGCQVGDCSLREAMQAADTPDPSIVTFAISGTFQVTRGQLPIYGSTVVMGDGAGETIIDAGGLSGVYAVMESSNNPAPFCRPTIRGVTITGGTQSGIEVEGDCTISLYDSVVRNNSSPNRGGGISYSGPAALVVTISNSAIISNTAPNGGGGLFMEDTFLQIHNSTISGNTTAGNGGGLYFVSSTSTPLTALLQSVTFANNSAMAGDAVAFEESAPPQESSVRFFNTILAASTGSACATLGFNTLTFESIGYNIATDESCTLTPLGTDFENSNPLLAPLSQEGNTFIHVPVLTSPALDTGAAGALTTDQRGFPRPVDLPGLPNANDGADRGAYEHQSVPPTAVTVTNFGTSHSVAPIIGIFLLMSTVFGMVAYRHFRTR